ncbi:transcription initiation factor TFIID subunit 5-like [Hibiscus syriacus]|uniref:transcription initiation factor TFIID subunit 5-like n=1 Tax=Hibiscus syriacus TaxID=106335 RepID=UPI001922A947|nr:transcription initiation factor TFIID subunit 5-like [Hibiscus syriacus]
MLWVINEHINFQVSFGQPSSISDDAEVVTLIGSCQDAANQINQKEIHWGLLEDSLEERLEKAGGLLSDSEKTEEENKEGDVDETMVLFAVKDIQSDNDIDEYDASSIVIEDTQGSPTSTSSSTPPSTDDTELDNDIDEYDTSSIVIENTDLQSLNLKPLKSKYII